MRLTGPVGWENSRAHARGDDLRGAWEYAFYSDAHVTGQIADGLGPYRLLNTVPVLDDTDSARPAMALHAQDHLGEEAMEIPEADWLRTDYDLDHGGYLDDEFAALVSLALGIRLVSGGQVRDWGHWTTAPEGKPVQFGAAPVLTTPKSRGPILPGISSWRGRRKQVALGDDLRARLAIYPALPSEKALALLRAARSFQMALWSAEYDPEFSWLRLVSALEVAATT